MNTTEQVIKTGRRRRRRHSALFKAEAVGACQQAGVSIAAVALAASPAESLIRIEIRRRGRTVSMQWPASAARECARLLRELVR